MKVFIPTAGVGGIDDVVGQHFGRVPTYTLVDLDTNDVEVIPNTSEHRGWCWSAARFHIEDGHPRHALLRAGTEKRFIYSKRAASMSSLVPRYGARCDRGMAAGAAHGSDR